MHQMILMGPVRASADCFTTCVGIGSSMQDLGLECLKVSLIEASVIVANSLNVNWQGGWSMVTNMITAAKFIPTSIIPPLQRIA